MRGSLLKNIASTNIGTAIIFLLTFISVPIFIRTVGLEGYAAIGIIFSFNQILDLIRIPPFLALIKTNTKNTNSKKKLKTTYSTIFNSILILSLVIISFGFVISKFLIKYIYIDQTLSTLFIIGLSILLIERMNEFFVDYNRAKGREINVQKSIIIGEIIGTTLSIILITTFIKSVFAIFIGIFISRFLQLAILSYLSEFNKYYELKISKQVFYNFFKKYSFQQYKIEIKDQLLRRSGLFISTLLLPQNQIGLITLFFSLQEKARKLYRSIWMHLGPMLEGKILKDQFKLLRIINYMNTILFLAVLLFLVSIGEFLYNQYFGEKVGDSFRIFLPFIISSLVYLSLMHYESFLFINRIQKYQNILTVALICLIMSLPVLAFKLKIIGVIISCVLINIIRAILVVYNVKKTTFKNKNILKNIIITILFVFISTISNSIFYQTLIFSTGIFILVLLNMKDIKATIIEAKHL